MSPPLKRKITDFFGAGAGSAKKAHGDGDSVRADGPPTPTDTSPESEAECGAGDGAGCSTSPPVSSESGVGDSSCFVVVPANPDEPQQFSSTDSTACSRRTLQTRDNDIGYYVHKSRHEIGDVALQQFLENPWVPPSTYTLPYSVHMKKGKEEKRFLRHEHLQTTEWLVFSKLEGKKGLYCKYCPFFVPSATGGRNPAPLRQLVTEPVTKFSKLLGKEGVIETHAKNEYHQNAVLAGKYFLRVMQNPERDISGLVDSYILEQKKNNRARLRVTIENVEFLGRQGMALRGHRENTTGLKNKSKQSLEPNPSESEGNFLALLKFRKDKCKDSAVIKHLETATDRNTFTSKVIQNDVIECCAKDITTQIVEKSKKTKYYSVIFDETTDISHLSELSLSIRYTDGDGETIKGIREDFLGFTDPRRFLDDNKSKSGEESSDEDGGDSGDETDDSEQVLTGIKLGWITVELLKKHGLDLDHCVGIGTDGCSVNTSDLRGAVQEIQKTCKNAVKTPCFNHSLNLSVSKSSEVSAVQKALTVIRDVGSFFRSSSKKFRNLQKLLNRTLPKLCETRWVERHNAVTVFFENFTGVISALQTVSTWKESKTATKASQYVDLLLDPEFLVTLICLNDTLAATVSLSRLLQKESLDLSQASNAYLDTLNVLEEKRSKSEEIFSVLFTEAVDLGEKYDVEIKLPRGAKRGRHPTADIEPYYRQAVYNAILDNVITDLKERLSPEVLACYNLNLLIPSKVLSNTSESEAALPKIAAKYASLLNQEPSQLEHALKAEWALWKSRWTRVRNEEDDDGQRKKIPSSVLESLDACYVELFPNIREILLVLAALPASVATAERSFSTLRRIKTWMRSTMGETRLSGLTMLNVHRDIPLNYDNVIKLFCLKNEKRKKKLCL
ncbi:52 kDa repressor of the inhibitor of the protein kinase [Frankliniella fusca]|uniref:52 kDa repressor of the inhibitor of the protein kinase n=1 Tax=Frankliniella fusca TaxID=407009 RepID=A0AAE1LQU5_9NEOP|nr:52 kDa repressor of the inhibitor of the protein kinase [Frankliniella fusca]